MNYKDINNKWKQFLNENTFKEDALIDKKKNKKKDKKREDGKEIIVSEDDVNEWEEFEETVVNGLSGAESDTNDATDSVEEEKQLEEMSAMSGGAVQGYAGNAFAPKKKIKPY